jgi:hypothetical protein
MEHFKIPVIPVQYEEDTNSCTMSDNAKIRCMDDGIINIVENETKTSKNLIRTKDDK